MRRKQKQLEKKRRRAAKLEAEKEAARVAKMEAEAREQEEIAARRKRLLEQQQDARFRQKHIRRKEKLAGQKWDNQLDILLAQIKDRFEKDNKLEEIRIIIQNREPSLQELDWDSWLSDPLNQKLADLDFDYAMEMFKRDNLMAKRRHPVRGKGRRAVSKYALVFTGDAAASAAEDYVITTFDPDTYELNKGFTVSYWVRPDEQLGTQAALGRRAGGNEKFFFGISKTAQNRIWVGVGRTGATNNSGITYPGMDNGEWYHWAITYNGDSNYGGNNDRKIYMNGDLIYESDVRWYNTGNSGGGENMYFGGRNNNGSYTKGWACGLDQVAIFNTEKDAGWVASVYNTDKKKLDLSNESGLVGYWKFDEGSGTTVKDYSGNGNHGTFAPISGDTTAYPTWEYLGNVITR
jgi:hypothetical protein